MYMESIEIYTDGGCRGNGKNKNIGGFGAILIHGDYKKEIKGYAINTTNNVMELSAVVQALLALTEPCVVDLYSDSAYVVDSVKLGRLFNWAKQGWRTASNRPVKNQELWEMLLPLLDEHDVTFHKVKGHSDNELNNRCDELANIAMNEIEKGCV